MRRRFDACFVAHVDLQRFSRAAFGLDRLRRVLGEREVEVGDDDVGAVGGQTQRARPADPAPPADHQRAPAGKVEELGIVEHCVSTQV